jgi:N-acetylglutamate synthase-like GNAT family acetyltransferase
MQPEILEFQKDNYTISTDPARLDLEVIHDFLANRSYWAKGIPRPLVKKAIEHSLCFGLYHQGRQIGFARVLTDYARFAYLMDVFVLEEFRGKGLGKWLMECVFGHPELQGVRRWMLATWDAHSLYAKYGFTPLDRPDRLMEKVSKDSYPG